MLPESLKPTSCYVYTRCADSHRCFNVPASDIFGHYSQPDANWKNRVFVSPFNLIKLLSYVMPDAPIFLSVGFYL